MGRSWAGRTQVRIIGRMVNYLSARSAGRRISALLAAATLLILTGTGCDRGSHPEQLGTRAPIFALNDGEHAVDLNKLHGHVVRTELLGQLVRSLPRGTSQPRRVAARYASSPDRRRLHRPRRRRLRALSQAALRLAAHRTRRRRSAPTQCTAPPASPRPTSSTKAA